MKVSTFFGINQTFQNKVWTTTMQHLFNRKFSKNTKYFKKCKNG